MWSLLAPLILLCFILPGHSVFAQFNIFENMFGGQPFGGQPQQHQQRPSNVASDSAWYRQNFEAAQCDKYLCQGTLSCVDFPAHCPCPFPVQEDKVELSDNLAICGSKGGWKAGEMARKVELARKGLI